MLSETENKERKTHLDWCVERAMEYLDKGDAQQAFASFESDMLKNEHTAKQVTAEAILVVKTITLVSGLQIDTVRKYITGFP